jgi:hypothetical protein
MPNKPFGWGVCMVGECSEGEMGKQKSELARTLNKPDTSRFGRSCGCVWQRVAGSRWFM